MTAPDIVDPARLLGEAPPTPRPAKLVKTLGVDSLSKSQVSRMATVLDEDVEQFPHRPLNASGPFTLVAAVAFTMKLREGGRVINAVVLLVTSDAHAGLAEAIAANLPGGSWRVAAPTPQT